jgi:hypothetical protein
MSTKKETVKKVATKTPVKKAVKKAVPKKVAVKKVIKKASVKKTAVKKSSTKSKGTKTVNKELVYSDENTSFWLTDGQILNSLLALRDAFDVMNDEVFSYHVREDSNDFANWVGAVLCDENCARDLAKTNSPKSAKTVVVKHLKFYVV